MVGTSEEPTTVDVDPNVDEIVEERAVELLAGTVEGGAALCADTGVELGVALALELPPEQTAKPTDQKQPL